MSHLPDVTGADVADALAQLDSRLLDLERSSWHAALGLMALGVAIWLLVRKIDALEERAQREAKLWGGMAEVADAVNRNGKVLERVRAELTTLQGEHAGLDALVRDKAKGFLNRLTS